MVIAALVRLVLETVPPVALSRLVPAAVRLPGTPPHLAWPREGQAAVEVEGIGHLGSYPSRGQAGGSMPVPIASVAKIMTAYLTLHEHPLSGPGFALTITPRDAAKERREAALGESVLPVSAGERLSERQALQALLVPSANNIAELLAIADAGSVPAFLARMNATARRLGMTSTAYTDPSGFQPSTVSTATDQLKLARVAMRTPGFAGLVDERQVSLPGVGVVSNYDGLLGEEGYVGIKTGSTEPAGGCFVFAKRITVAGRSLTVLGVVLGQHAGSYIPSALSRARLLGNSVARAVGVRTALAKGAPVLSATSASGQRTTAIAARPLRVIGWAGLRVALEVASVRPGNTVRAGQMLGRVNLGSAASPAGPAGSPAMARRALPKPSLSWRLEHLL
jgi:D-alanyl-D-alanine carboxypeptidase (penicillin-binding protein 5/6)